MARIQDGTNANGIQPVSEVPRSVEVAAKGIRTSANFAEFMSALMSDLVSGKIAPGVGSAACMAGARMLQVVEMQQKYGTQAAGGRKELMLAEGEAGTDAK